MAAEVTFTGFSLKIPKRPGGTGGLTCAWSRVATPPTEGKFFVEVINGAKLGIGGQCPPYVTDY
jgi:hypothetical protein